MDEKSKYMWVIRTFRNKGNMEKFIEKYQNRIQYNQIFINNGYGITYKQLRRIY